MPHALISRPLGNVERLVLQHETGAELDVLSGRGGCLVGWRVVRNGQTHELLDGYASEADLHERYYSSHCGARLSPFPNRVKDGRWSFQGKAYQLPKNFPWENGHAIHGLLFDLPWQRTEFVRNGDIAQLTLACLYDGAQAGFPFAYRAINRYSLTAQGFSVETEVENIGDHDLPLGEGWHPYFRTGASIDNACLQMGSPVKKLEVDDRSIPTGISVPDAEFQTSQRIGAHNFNTCWEFAGPGSLAEVFLTDPQTARAFRYWQERGPGQYNYLQLYIPPQRESLAIEPMTCPPDVLNNQLGLIILAPKASHTLRWGVEVKL